MSTILIYANRKPRWNRRTDPTTKRAISKKAAEWVVNQEPSSMKQSIKEFTKVDGNTTSYSINRIKASARIRAEQNADLVLTYLKLKILGQPHDGVLLSTDRRLKYYKINEVCIILKDGLLFRKYNGETGSVKYYEILIPKQLVNEVLRNLVNILELPRRELHREKCIITQIWLN